MDKKRILIIYENIGTGHKRTAEAIKKAFDKHSDIEAGIENPFGEKFPSLSYLSTQIYLKALKLTPELWGYIYEMERDKIERKFNKLLGKSIYTFIKNYILDYKPDAIICTHPFSCSILSQIKKSISIPVYAILTDYDVHAYWIHGFIDGYFVGCDEMKKSMAKMGVSEDKIYVTGIPIDESFYKVNDKVKIREKLNFDIEKSLILVMGGGLGLGNIEKSVKILKEYDDLQIAVICGYNRSLKKRLLEYAGDNVHVYGHVDNVHEFMDAADLLITKSGGLTITEAIVKKLPMVIFDPIPGQEERNLQYLLKKKIAVRVKDIDMLGPKLRELIDKDKHKLNAMRERMSKIAIENSADRVCDIVIKNLNENIKALNM